MATETIVVSRSEAAVVIRLNRPARRNAISLQMMSEIVAALDEAERDRAVRSVIITGSTECFSAGADLNEALQVRSVPAAMDFLGNLHRLNNRIETLDKPVIAAINALGPTERTDYDTALATAQQGIMDASWVATTPTTKGLVYFFSDGVPVDDGDAASSYPDGDKANAINDKEEDAWEGRVSQAGFATGLADKGVVSIAVGLGADVASD
ncbi:MAG: enoyl-CoA hydratase/isomerase family protein, partial [Rhodospirillales bacterium]|nr:enoyl-CoA hydratase/isomerase family protein [Rhodospirillales bacterium]